MKWTISDEDDSDAEGAGVATATATSPEKTVSSTVTVWWAATLASKTDKMHTLTDEERGEGGSNLYQSSCVRVPIYGLNYAPMKGKCWYCLIYVYRNLCYFIFIIFAQADINLTIHDKKYNILQKSLDLTLIRWKR